MRALQVETPEGNHEITDITLQGSAAECCTAVLQVLHHASATYSQNNDLSTGNFAQPAWQFTHKVSQIHGRNPCACQPSGLPATLAGFFAPAQLHSNQIDCGVQDQQEVLSTSQLTSLPLEMFAPDEPCMHLPSSCFLTLPLAVQCCQLLAQGQSATLPRTPSTTNDSMSTSCKVTSSCTAAYCCSPWLQSVLSPQGSGSPCILNRPTLH